MLNSPVRPDVLFKIKIQMSRADHSESDGQSERTNRRPIEILRSYVNERNTNWVEFSSTL